MRPSTPFHPYWAFLDTGGYYGLLNRRDLNHEVATTIYQRLGREHWRLFTTNFVLPELHALMLSKLGRRPARQALAFIHASQATTLVRVTPADEQRALAILDQYDDKNFSYTDCTSFAVMDRLGIGMAFAFDGNFPQYGFTVLRAS